MNPILLLLLVCSVIGVARSTPINSRARDSLGGVPSLPSLPSLPPQQPQPPTPQFIPSPPRPPFLPLQSGQAQTISTLPEFHIQTKDFTYHQEAVGSQDDGTAVKGEYSFSVDGITSNVVYVADNNGYRAKILYTT